MKFNFYVDYDPTPEVASAHNELQTMRIRARSKEQAKEIFEQKYPQFGCVLVSEYPPRSFMTNKKKTHKKTGMAFYSDGMEE